MKMPERRKMPPEEFYTLEMERVRKKGHKKRGVFTEVLILNHGVIGFIEDFRSDERRILWWLNQHFCRRQSYAIRATILDEYYFATAIRKTSSDWVHCI